MIKFSNLLDDLLLSPSKKKKVKILVNYFNSLDIDEKAWAFSILTGKFSNKYIKAMDIKNMIKEKISNDLFSYSYDYVGDLAETFSLLWPKKKKSKKISLNFFMKKITSIDNKDSLLNFLKQTFNDISSNQIFAIIKILTGGLRVGVSEGILKECFVKLGSKNKYEIDEYWHAFSFPFKDFFYWLNGGSLPKNVNTNELFHSFMLANNFEEKLISSTNIKDYFSEFKWDGIRAQIVFSDPGKVFSRSGDDITHSFPDLNIKRSKTSVIDGELVVKKNDKILSFNDLQKRIGRKKVSSKMLQSYPIHLIAYDILFLDNLDCRHLKLKERRKKLESFITLLNIPNISISPLILFKTLNDLKSIRDKSLNNHIEGIVLKNKNSEYIKGRPKKCWYKWKRNPFIIDFVIMYAQRGHGKRSSFYSDFTFGCWEDGALKKLVPVGKAYSGFTNEELKLLDKWVRNNTLERFGPVRSVKIGLVVEIAFDNINFSTRHKSGVALRFPRFSRIRWDKPHHEVCTLSEIKSLIN
jgi:DNA ligase-1